ncbi:MAG: hypothetical protein LM577_05580 [Thermoproteaceae archaeon]|nr:hypothetical protein [Thermoproteaceae archaeon]
MITAADAGVRIARCYSLETRRVETVGVAAIAAVTSSGAVDVIHFSVTSPETRDFELEVLRHYSRTAEICVVDGPPAAVCRKNVGIIKSGNPAAGWRCVALGPYAVCADFELSVDIARLAIRLNALAHRVAHEAARTLFRRELLRRRCVLAEGAHVVPELSYYH